MSFITSAIGGISDGHIAEFAFVKPKKIYTGVLMKIAAAAACAAVIVTAVPRIGSLIPGKSTFSFPSDIITNCWDDPENENNARVVFNGITYLFDNDDLSRTPDHLRAEFEHVGDVLTVDPENSEKDGYSLGCSVGDPIYMDTEFPGEIYVLTSSVTGDDKYIRFTEYETYKVFEEVSQMMSYIYGGIEVNNKYYYDLGRDVYVKLLDRFKLIETITDPYSGREELIYQDPDHPEEIFVYKIDKTYSEDEYFYYRYTDFDACRHEGKIKRRNIKILFEARASTAYNSWKNKLQEE